MPSSRRTVLKQLAAGAAALGATSLLPKSLAAQTAPDLKGNIRHSVARWPFGDLSLEELCQGAKALGIESVEILHPDDFDVVLDYGLSCAMVHTPWGGTSEGFNHVENHEQLIPAYRERIPQVAEVGFSNIVAFTGNRNGISEEEGLENCVAGIQEVIGVAEEHDVTICIEFLNSKLDHPDYQFDNMAFGVELVERVGSDHFKILYDIYHAQVDEGDIIQTIRDHSDIIGHYHTAGVPGRNELDDTQELNYPAIMEAIVESGFDGWVGHEFIPTRDDVLESLREAVEVCDV